MASLAYTGGHPYSGSPEPIHEVTVQLLPPHWGHSCWVQSMQLLPHWTQCMQVPAATLAVAGGGDENAPNQKIMANADSLSSAEYFVSTLLGE